MLSWLALAALAALVPEVDQISDPSLPEPLQPAVLQTDDGALVLEHVDVRAQVQAGMAVVEVEHTFRNPFDRAIDATYVFPLPTDAAVRHMELEAGEQRLVAAIDTRESAREAYEQARQEGRKAALLEQQRDNVFTQEVSAICAGETVHVTVEYAQRVPYEDGVYTFALPTTMGERFAPGDLEEPPLVGSLAPGRDLTVELAIDEGLPMGSLWSDTHPIRVLDEDLQGALLDLGGGTELPNRDVIVQWTLHADQPRAAMVVSPEDEGDGGYFALSVEPQLLEDLEDPRARELLFVLDSSCSMRGAPWGAAVETVTLALDQMRPDDRFNLVKFSNAAGSMFERPAPATPENIRRAKQWLKSFRGGGTVMEAGLVHSLDMPGDRDAMRLVLMLTDGYIGNEDHIFDVVDDHLGDARLFSLGVGSSVNRYLLEGLARVGRGDVTYQTPGTPIGDTVAAFVDRWAHPAMTDIHVDFGDLDVWDVSPDPVPDLWVGQPLRVVGRYRGAGAAEVTVTGQIAGRRHRIRLPVDLDHAETHEAVPVLWARTRIGELKDARRRGDDSAAAAITALALEHHLVSDYTSLLAEAAHPSACATDVAEVAVPALAPVGVAHDPRHVAANSGVLGLIGTKGTQIGAGGLGARGSGIGGGGTAEGLGGLGTRGTGSGASGYGAGGGHFGKREGALPVFRGNAIVLGALDRSLIDEVVKRHLNAIRYCYQRELTKHPGLTGKLVVKFTVAADGSVTSATVKSSTLGNEAVEQCVVARFQRMAFPAPAGGGIVIVSYPFAFEPADE